MKPRIILSLLAMVGLLGVAHIFRFVPMSQREAFDFIPMWDRWFQRVCVISILGDNQVSCSVEAFTRQFSKANVATPRPMTEVEKLRRAGFSEREVLEWVETALKTKRQQGMSDAALASYLFGDETRGSKQTGLAELNLWELSI